MPVLFVSEDVQESIQWPILFHRSQFTSDSPFYSHIFGSTRQNRCITYMTYENITVTNFHCKLAVQMDAKRSKSTRIFMARVIFY